MVRTEKRVYNTEFIYCNLAATIILLGYIGSMIYLTIYIDNFKYNQFKLDVCEFKKDDCTTINKTECVCGNLTYNNFKTNYDLFERPSVKSNGCYSSFEDFCLRYMFGFKSFIRYDVKGDLYMQIIIGLVIGSILIASAVYGCSCVCPKERSCIKTIYIDIPQKFINKKDTCTICDITKTDEFYNCTNSLCNTTCCPSICKTCYVTSNHTCVTC